jgi:hypothetical protein
MPSLETLQITWDDHDRPVITVKYSSTSDGDDVGVVDADEFLRALVDRITDESASNLRALIEANNDKGPVALGDLAHELGVDKKKIDGWNRNFGRSAKAVVRDLGFLRPDEEDGTQQLFDFKWDAPGNRWLYVVPEKYRESLLRFLDER